MPMSEMAQKRRGMVVTFRTKADSLTLSYRSARSAPSRICIARAVIGGTTAAPQAGGRKRPLTRTPGRSRSRGFCLLGSSEVSVVRLLRLLQLSPPVCRDLFCRPPAQSSPGRPHSGRACPQPRPRWRARTRPCHRSSGVMKPKPLAPVEELDRSVDSHDVESLPKCVKRADSLGHHAWPSDRSDFGGGHVADGRRGSEPEK